MLDHARRRNAAKRGGAAHRLSLDTVAGAARRDVDVIALDEAVGALAELDPEQAQVVELRCVPGLRIAETADAPGISTATVERDWVTTRVWLFGRLNRGDAAKGAGR